MLAPRFRGMSADDLATRGVFIQAPNQNLGGGWVIERYIEECLGSVNWAHLRNFLGRRVRDRVIRQPIGRWLNAAVMQAGELSYPDQGNRQDGVVSPR